MTSLLREVLFSSRGFWRRSSFPGVLLALALGVGANGATLTLAAALLLAAPAHVRSPERIVRAPSIRSWAEFTEVRRRARTIDLAAHTRSELGLGLGAEAAPARVECVTRGYFRLLGVRPALGRTFAETADGGRAGASVVLSHGLWTRRFGGDPAVVGRAVLLGNRGHAVVGVAPRGFRGLGPAAVDAWMLLTASPDLCSFTGEDLLDDRNAAWLWTIGRPRDGFTPRDAQAEVATLTSSGGAGASGAGRAHGLVPAFGATRAGTRDGQVVLWLAAAGGLMLLAACLNVAVLLSIQVLDRAGEFAVRRQLGATRARVFAQFLLEHLAAAAVCGAAAAGVGMAVGGLLAGLLPIAGGEEFRGAPFFARVGALTLLAGVCSGLGPAAYLLRASRPSRRQDAALAAPSGGGVRGLLVTAQFALALVLVVGAGLFVSTVRHVDRTPGLDVDRVIVATVDLARNGYGAGQVRSVFDEFLQRLDRVPRVASAGVSLAPLLSSGGSFAAYPLRAASGEAPRDVPLFNAVSRGYFRTVGTRIVRGRGFTADDAGGRPVLVVNEGLAGELWGAADPLGRCVVIGGLPCVEVVGVSENRRPVTVTGGHDEVFVPASQASSYVDDAAPRTLLVRSRGPARAAVGAVAAALRGTDPDLPFIRVRLLADLVDDQTRSWRLGAAVFSLLGGFAVALAAVGGFAVLSLSVRSRAREIGIRMALGARRGNVVAAVLRRGLGVVTAGLVLGGAVSAAAYRLMGGLLVGVSAADPASFAAAVLVVFSAGAAAAALPAVRAARLDPAEGVRRWSA